MFTMFITSIYNLEDISLREVCASVPTSPLLDTTLGCRSVRPILEFREYE